MKLNIQYKLIGFTLCITLMVCGFISIYSICYQRQQIFETFKNDCLDTTVITSEIIKDSIYNMDIRLLVRLLTSVRTNPDINYTYVMDLEGILLTDGIENIAMRNQKLTNVFINEVLVSDGWITKLGNKVAKVGGPILMPDARRIGYLYVEFSLERVNQIIYDTTLSSIYVTLICLFLGGILAFVLSKSFSNPILSMVQASKKIGKGKLHTKVLINRKDELGVLADSFNKMTEDLQKTTVSRDYVNNIIKTMADTLIVMTPDGIIEAVNHASLNFLGYTEDELINRPIVTILAEDECLFRKTEIAELIKAGFITNVEKIYISKDGRRIPVLFSGAVMYDVDDNIQAVVCVARDITERKQIEKERIITAGVERKRTKKLKDTLNELEKAQEASLSIMEDLETERTRLKTEITARKKLEELLSSEKERLSVTLHSIGDGVVATDNQGNVVVLNRVAQELTGRSQEEALGSPLSEVFRIINEKTREPAENPVEKVLERGVVIGLGNDTVLIAKDGKEMIIEDSAAPIFDNDGNIIGVVLVFRDMTERRQLEKDKQDMQVKMLTTSKLSSLGEVATGMAHEINQPLTYISCFIQGLKLELKEGAIDIDHLKEGSEISLKLINRINNIIQHLRTFGRREDVLNKQISIKTVLDNTLLLMRERIRLKNIKLINNIETDLPMVSGNSNQLEQVFINLFQNSIDAFENKSEDSSICVDIFSPENKESVIINVKDNGKGIGSGTLAKIFDPFFTTKEVGKGTGLGLSIIYGIVREHNGTISCESEINKGATFTIMLPVA